MKPKIGDAEFVASFKQIGGYKLARELGVSVRGVFQRRANLESKLGIKIDAPSRSRGEVTEIKEISFVDHPQRKNLTVKNGTVLIASDAHYWPGKAPMMHRAFLWACKELSPNAVIMNGDVIDAASISRHPRINWEDQPTVQDEIETAQERLHDIELLVKRSTPLIWCLGNHDARYEIKLAAVAPEFEHVHGIHLKDHFPSWEPAWSVWINDSTVIKHRLKGGIHATHNNTLWSGKHIITGHLHSAKVTPFTDYNGTRYGVDTGCLADTDHKAFEYLEDNPRNWRSAFCVLTYVGGNLLPPELVFKYDEKHVTFRGKLIKI